MIPQICPRISNIYKDENYYYLAMEKCEESLLDLLNKKGILPFGLVVKIAF